MDETHDGRTPVPHRGLARRIMPPGWGRINAHPLSDFWLRRDGLRAMVSAAIERDARTWLHVSLSREDRLPSWDDVREVREAFIPDELVALSVLPPSAEYVNVHPYVLHLWACCDGRVTPDFRTDGAI